MSWMSDCKRKPKNQPQISQPCETDQVGNFRPGSEISDHVWPGALEVLDRTEISDLPGRKFPTCCPSAVFFFKSRKFPTCFGNFRLPQKPSNDSFCGLHYKRTPLLRERGHSPHCSSFKHSNPSFQSLHSILSHPREIWELWILIQACKLQSKTWAFGFLINKLKNTCYSWGFIP